MNSNVFSAADMSTAAANGHRDGYQAGYADAVKAFDAAQPAAAQEAAAWRDDAGNLYPDKESVDKYLPRGRTVHALYAAPVAAAPVDGLRLAVIGRAHFGNPIPQEWYAAARELLSSTPAAPGIDLTRRIRLHLDRAASINGDMQAGLLLAELDGAPCAMLEELQHRMADVSPKGGSGSTSLDSAIAFLAELESVGNQRAGSLASELRGILHSDHCGPKGGSDAPTIPEPHQECYSDNDGDSWYDHPADSCLVDGLAVGDTYTLSVSHYSVGRTYRVTKAPDETSDDYEVEPVQATSAEVGHG